jgi:hypothetical protein
MTPGQKIKQQIKREYGTIKKFAEAFGMSPNTVSAVITRNTCLPETRDMLMLAGIDTTGLYTGRDVTIKRADKGEMSASEIDRRAEQIFRMQEQNIINRTSHKCVDGVSVYCTSKLEQAKKRMEVMA